MILFSIDTTSVLNPDTVCEGCRKSTSLVENIPPQIVYAFLISCLILLIATIIKHALGADVRKIKKMHIFMELTIDFCAIIATIIASMQTDASYELVLLMAFCSLIPIIFGSVARQYWLIYAAKGICWQSVVSATVNILMPIIWLVVVCETFFFQH